jgi:hypothetical protein
VFSFTANGDQIAERFGTKGETNFTFKDMLSPLEPYRKDLLVVEGVDKFHWKLPDGQRADGHQQGGSALAPWKSGGGSFPIGGTCDDAGNNCKYIGYVQGPSIDKVIGDRVVKENASVRFPFLNLRVGSRENHIWNTHCHAGPLGTQSPISPETDPFAVYKRIFGGVSRGEDPAARAELERRIAMKQSALDIVKPELDSMKKAVSKADRLRLDSHFEAIRTIERGLTTTMPMVSACAPQKTDALFASTYDVINQGKYRDVGFLFYKLMAMAFACDLTRVVNFNWSGNTDDRTYSGIQYDFNGQKKNISEGHHTISHNSSDESFAKIRAIKKHLFECQTKLFEELKAIDEGGQSLFDNTVIVHWSELSQGDTHQQNQDLVIFAGGGGKYFRTGRYVNMDGRPKRSFSNLLVSCFNYMHSDVTTFGETSLMPDGAGVMPSLGV